jgi:hypothetical protein
MKKPAFIAVCLLLLGVAHAADFPNMPPMKEGFWKIRMVDTSPGEKPTESTYSLCRDHAYDLQVLETAKKFLAACTTNSDSTSGNKRSIVQSCKVGKSIIQTKSVLTVSGDTHYHSESSTTFTPALYGQTQGSMVQDQTYVGACPAGMHPGDRQRADGTIQRR